MNDFLNLPPLRKPRQVKPKPVPISHEAKRRYQQAHEQDFQNKYRLAYNGGHYFAPKMPDTSRSNGLTQAIINFLMWSGHRATRVNSVGRMIKGKYIPGTTRKGAADISSTVFGKSVMWEIKSGKDKPSEYQLKEQMLEEKAGGKYFFVHNIEEFFQQYDSLKK